MTFSNFFAYDASRNVQNFAIFVFAIKGIVGGSGFVMNVLQCHALDWYVVIIGSEGDENGAKNCWLK